jgi:hypothetical protein
VLVCRGGKHRNPDERKGENQNGSFFRLPFLFFSSPSLVLFSSFRFDVRREGEKKREEERERELFCPLALSSLF